MSLPSNWGKKTFQERENMPTQEAYDRAFPKIENVENQSRGEGSTKGGYRLSLPITDCLMTPVVDHSRHILNVGILYEVWLNENSATPIWIRRQGRKDDRIGNIYRHLLRQMARAFAGHYRRKRKTGRIERIRILGDFVEIDLLPEDESDPELKWEYLRKAQSLLGPCGSNKELENFYKMIKESNCQNFWLLEYYPILMSIVERYYFPADSRLELQTLGDWEVIFKDFVEKEFGEKESECMIYENIAGKLPHTSFHKEFVDIFNKNRKEEKAFTPDCVGLNRFTRVLVIHGCDNTRTLPIDHVELELSNRFPLMLVHLFAFLFKLGGDEISLSFLAKRRPPIPEDRPNSFQFKTLLRFLIPRFLQNRPLSSSPGAPSNVVLVKSEDELKSALSKAPDGSLPAIFYFTAVWCGPCRFISPVIGELSEKYPHVTTFKIDIDEEGLGSTLGKLNISSVPTFQFFQNGKKAAEVVGADAARLKDTFAKLYKPE